MFAFAAGSAFAFLYHWLAEGLFGATLGKALIGIAVERASGGRCGLGASLVRNLLRVVDGIGVYLVGLVAALVSRSRQRLGDRLARTVVIERPLAVPARIVLAVIWAVAVTAGVAAAVMLHRAPGLAPAAVSISAGLGAAAGGNLRLVNPGFLERQDGPPRPQGPYRRGELVYFRYQILGFGRGPDGKAKLEINGAIKDPDGLALHRWSRTFDQPVPADEPISAWVSTEPPGFAPPGPYEIEITVQDEVSQARLDYRVSFEVVGEAIAPASQLEVRGFEVAVSEEGPAVSPLVLEGGGRVYLRWKMVGIAFRGDDMDVRVGLKVFGPGGQLLFDKPDFVSERETVAYHPRGFFLPISGRLNIPSGAPKGTYTLRFEATDNVAESKADWSARFQVR